tara:strand:+ start:29 stop:337 length:309 start_codon:yes stop_codon:yes gene_type:complete
MKKNIFLALKREGVPINDRYENIHTLPLFKKKIAYGSKGFPWTLNKNQQRIKYKKGSCPVAESLNKNEYLSINMHKYDYTLRNINQIGAAFKKVWENMIFND